MFLAITSINKQNKKLKTGGEDEDGKIEGKVTLRTFVSGFNEDISRLQSLENKLSELFGKLDQTRQTMAAIRTC